MNQKQAISKWMKRNVVSVRPDATVRQAAALLAEKRVGTLPVTDDAGTLVGVASMRDIIEVFLPDFVSLLSDISFVEDYGDLGSPSPESFEKAESLLVADIMAEPVAAEAEWSLIRALAIMNKQDLLDLPVIKEGKLVGIASMVDIGRAFLVGWRLSRTTESEAG